MADFAAQQLTTAGITPVANAANAGGDTVPPDVTLRVNSPSAAITLTLVTPGTVDGLAVANRDVAIGSGQVRYVRVPGSLYRDPATGRCALTWTGTVTAVTVEVIR